MKRIRLDIGALTASPHDGGSFMFFLYREGMDRCLPVKLSPPDMHAVLSNFNQTQSQENGPTVHNLFVSALQQFRIELLEVTVIRDEEADAFACQLLLFDGEKEVQMKSGFIDGVILAKIFACPIYTDEQLMEKYASEIDIVSEKIVKKEIHLQKLREELANAIAAEDYEKAAKINKAIGELDKDSKQQ
jgi:bifunctional DNase/RNase